MMKQPKIELKVYNDLGMEWVDIEGKVGEECCVGIGCGLTEKAAWKAAKRRLEEMVCYVEKQISA